MPTNVGGSGVVLTFDEPAGPGYRAYISNEAHRAVLANLETDEMRIAVFPEGSTEPTVYLALRGWEGLLTWHEERPPRILTVTLLDLVTSNSIPLPCLSAGTSGGLAGVVRSRVAAPIST